MANEITVNASLAYADSEGTEDSLAVVNFLKTVATKLTNHHKQSIGTTEVAINLAGLTTPGFMIAINRDATNFVELRVATGGAKFARLDPGGVALVRLGSGAQVPFAIADTAACQVEFLICSI